MIIASTMSQIYLKILLSIIFYFLIDDFFFSQSIFNAYQNISKTHLSIMESQQNFILIEAKFKIHAYIDIKYTTIFTILSQFIYRVYIIEK